MTLRERVAQAVRENSPCRIVIGGWPERTADAAIGVVLAAVAEQVDEPLRSRLHDIELDDVHGYERALDDVLAVLARLGEAR